MSNIKVAVRVRPVNKRELDHNAKVIVDSNGDNVSVTNIKVDSQAEFGDSRERTKTFTFDYCYDSTGNPQSPEYAAQQLKRFGSNDVVFQDLGTEVLQAAFEGYNACVFAYGQTSTGKTYTMTGTRDDPGLIPRICEGLFSHVDDFETSENITFRINISYLEIYNERVRDLLRPSLSQRNEKYTLKVREHPKEGPYVQDLSSHVVKDNDQIQTLLDKGNESRVTAATYMHDHSSRSHAIVTVTFIQAKLDDDLPHEIVSKIHLVDLAGSERADPNWSMNYKGRLKEGSNINKSLVTLGNVIKSLAEKSILSWSTDSLGSTQSFVSSAGGEGRASPFCSPKRVRLPYIPYRDSVLTWLLKDSLGGNSKTIMISTVSPASICYNETISTLRYAQRAKNIVNKPKINEDASVTLIRELRLEIDKLKQMLAATQMGVFQHNDIMYVVPHSKSHGEGESLAIMKDSGTALEQELQMQEDRANKLTQTWIDKWVETHEIMKESDLSITGLHRKTSSMGVLIDSQMPHLIGMDSDILSTGVVIYHLKEGKTLLGREDAKREQDIVLSGPGIQREHCYIKNIGGSVSLCPNRGSQCIVNGIECKTPILLKQGDSIILGKGQMLRFNNPAEAAVLRERRSSQENILDECKEDEYNRANTEFSGQSMFDGESHRHRPGHRAQSLEIENQYKTEAEKIQQAKEELERLQQEHQKAEEVRQLKEEELWNIHNKHLQEIEEEKKRLTKLKEETLIQRHKAEQELLYARECLDKEREAFYQELQQDLSKLHASKSTSTSSQEVCVFTDANVPSDEVIDSIRKRKLSLEGQLKTIVQKEILKTHSHRETERSLQRKSDNLEDEFEMSKHQIEGQLVKIKEIEEHYRQSDAQHYTEINRTEEELEEIQRREEQLELYIEEKQDLLNVKSDRPRPLRTACSAEVLTNLEMETEFGEKTSSMLALNHGSVGDLPAISHQFSLSSMMSVDSQSSGSDLNLDSTNKSHGAKHKRISSNARSVTDRLYQKSTPKFKYEPKTRKSASPLSDHKTRLRKGKRSDDDSPHRPHDSRVRTDSESSDSSTSLRKHRRISPSNVDNSGETLNNICDNQNFVRSSKRADKSSTSLASVPEAVEEEREESFMHSTPDVSQVVRRRNKGRRKFLDDDFRRHSEPSGDTLAEAFENYTMAMEQNGSNHNTSLPPEIPSLTVTDYDNSTSVDKDDSDSLVQECPVTMEVGEGHQQCPVSRDASEGGMECHSQPSQNVINNQSNHSNAKNICDNNRAVDDNMDRITDFHVDLVPIIKVSYCEGDIIQPMTPDSQSHRQFTDSSVLENQDDSEQDLYGEDEVNSSDNFEKDSQEPESVRMGRKRESKTKPSSNHPSKVPKSEKNNYEWLVNAFSRLSQENLLDFDEENVDNSNTEGHAQTSKTDNNVAQNKNTSETGLDNDGVYYSDSLEDDDSLNGSKPSVEEDMSDSLNGSDHHIEENMEYFSESDPDIMDSLGTEGTVPEISDYDDLDETAMEDRAEIYIQYPTDFPGSLLYSIKEESVPASPDLSESKDISPDVSSMDDNYLSQVVVLGNENQPSVTKSDVQKTSQTTTINNERTVDATQDDLHVSSAISNQLENDLGIDQETVHSEANITLMAEMEMLKESQIVSRYVGSVGKQSNDLQTQLQIKEVKSKSNSENIPHQHDQENEEMNSFVEKSENEDLEQANKTVTMDLVKELDDVIDIEKEKSKPQSLTTEEMTEYLSSVASAINKAVNLISDSGNKDNELPKTANILSDSGNKDNESPKTANVISDSGNKDNESPKTANILSDSGNKDNESPKTANVISDSGNKNNESPKTANILSDSGNKDNESPKTADVISDSGKKDDESSKIANVISDSGKKDNESSKAENVLFDSGIKDTESSEVDILQNLPSNTSIDSLNKDSCEYETKNILNDNDIAHSTQNEIDTTTFMADVKETVDHIVDSVVKSRSRPTTRTLGVSTTPDLVTVGCGENSDDSLQDVQDELLVLQEALDSRQSKYTATNGGSLSSARKAMRKRAMEKRGTGVCTESEELMSDESPEIKSSSSRPDSASRRRKRPNNKPTERSGKKSKGLSSDEYVTSETDSSYSDNSHSWKSHNEAKEVPINIAQTLNDCIDELTESIAQNDDLMEGSMEEGLQNGYEDSKSPNYEEKSRHQLNGSYIPNLQLSDLDEGNLRSRDPHSTSWRSYDSSIGHSSRSASETRDASQQTDDELLSLPLRSPMSTQTEAWGMPSLTMSPISVWNSVDKCIKSPQGHADESRDCKSPGAKKIKKTKTCKLSDLSYTVPETWSADLTDVPQTFQPVDSGSESDGDNVVMETETCSPATPSTHDHFFESSYAVLQDPPTKIKPPVKYEVTIKPEETNIMYNVEKTEIKSYGLNSPGRERGAIPESININVTNRTANVTENRYETTTRQQFQLNQSSEQPVSGNVVSERTFRASRELSTDISSDNLEVRSERSCAEADENHYVETTCEAGFVDTDKVVDQFSPRESDTTSDYGTMIYDRKRGVSAAYDSDDIDSLASYGRCLDDTPRGDQSHDNLQAQNDSQLVHETDRSSTCEEVTVPLQVEGLELKANTSHDMSRSSEDVYVSAEISRTSSTSSDYKTPQQSPRADMGVPCDNVNVPDVSEAASLPNGNVLVDIKTLKTVSVNTESQQRCQEEIRETLKNDLQKKIEELKYSRKNKDDSAISSDYTDGDSVSVSPRASVYETDKLSRLGSMGSNEVEVRTTRTDTSFEPSNGAQSYLPKLVDIDNKSVQKTPLKDSGNVFDDDLDELMSETTEYLNQVQNGENVSDSDTVTGRENHTPVCIGDAMEEEISDRSLSPGEIVADDLYEQFASGLNSGGEMDSDSESKATERENICDETIDVIPDGRNSAELLEMMDDKQCTKTKKSPSMSNIRHDSDAREYRRSVSENCIDQYEENESVCSSNSDDSIMFVFMGQSHTRESMEKLKDLTSKDQGYKVHDSDDNILSQNNQDDDDHSYENSDSREEMIENMEKILSQDGSPDITEEIQSQEISTADDISSPEISESQNLSENYVISQETSEDISSLDNLDQTDPFASGENSPQMVEEVIEYQVSTSENQKPKEEEEEPLRHKFGIDESILPIPTRSVSSDNLPRKISNLSRIHRSRSTSLLDVETVDKATHSSDNEGIFPPNVQRSEHNSEEIPTKEEQSTSPLDTEAPPTPAPSVADDAEYTKQQPINQDVLYSSLVPLQDAQLDLNGNIDDSSLVPTNAENTAEDTATRFVSTGIQASLADSETQTDTSVVISHDGQLIQLLPGLDSPLRAHSMQTLRERMTQFNPSEDSQNWYNLSSLMLETIPLLQTINQRLPGADISRSASTEIAYEKTSLATQTSSSLEKLSSISSKVDVTATGTQTRSDESNSNDLERLEISVQTDEPELMSAESSDISVQTDLLWSTATALPVTETTTSLAWNVQEPEVSSALFSVDRSSRSSNQTNNVSYQIASTETSDSRSEKVKSDDEDSSEEMYTETSVMYYDFVNKCYVQNVENFEWQKIRKEKGQGEAEEGTVTTLGSMPTDIREGLDNMQSNSSYCEKSVKSQATVQEDNTSIDRGVRIHPKYSGYVYRTSTTPEPSQHNEERYDRSSFSTVLQAKTDEKSTSGDVEWVVTEEIIMMEDDSDDVGKSGSDSENSKQTETITSQKAALPEYYSSEMPEEVTTEEIILVNNSRKPMLENNRTASPDEIVTEEIILMDNDPKNSGKVSTEEVTLVDKDRVDSPEEVVTEEVIILDDRFQSYKEPEQLVVREENTTVYKTNQHSRNAEPKAIDRSMEQQTQYRSRYSRNSDSVAVDRNGEPRKQYSWESYRTRDKTSSKEQGLPESQKDEPVSSESQTKTTTTLHNTLTDKWGAEKYRSEERNDSARYYMENKESEKTNTLQQKSKDPLFSESYTFDRRPIVERHVDHENVVEDIVSPRKDDIVYSLPSDARTLQAGSDQNSNKQESTSSQSDGSQRSSETGQSHHHSYESKTIKKTPLEDKGDDSDDEDKDGRDEVFEQISEHHFSKHDNTQIQTILTEREHVMETEFYVPDIEASQAEMDALKQEHDKTIAAINQAAAERKQRTDELKNKTKQVIETELEMTKEVENWNEQDRKNNDRQVKFDMNAVETREYSVVSEDSATQSREDLAEKITGDDQIIEKKKEPVDDTEDKLKRLESVFKDYVKLERELKEREEKSKTDLVDDVLSDSEEYKSLPSRRQNFSEYRVQTNVETSETKTPIKIDREVEPPITKTDRRPVETPITKTNRPEIESPISKTDKYKYLPTHTSETIVTNTPMKDEHHITKTDRNNIKFLPTCTSEARETSKPVKDQQTITKDTFKSMSAQRKPYSLSSETGRERQQTNQQQDEIISSTSSIRRPEYDELSEVSRRSSSSGSFTRVPAAVQSSRKPVVSRSLSVDTYSNRGTNAGTRSMGVEVSVDSSDDFTQTDADIFPDYEPPKTSTRKDTGTIKNELDRLHKERIEIIELLGLNYLPASLTIELLEAKLNYCIGQTDLLLNSIDDTWTIPDTVNINETHTHVMTKEYLTKYREDLRKSKKDLKICQEKMDIKSGKGRGRPMMRSRDLQRLRRQAEIEAFKAERQMEQQNFITVKSLNRINPAYDEVDRKARSSSPRSYNSNHIRTMTPSEHAAYLIKLRKQVVKATEHEDVRQRISRSCSPFIGNRYQTDNSTQMENRSAYSNGMLLSPRSHSATYDESLHLPSYRSYSAHSSEPRDMSIRSLSHYTSESYSIPPRISITDAIDYDRLSSYSPRSYSADHYHSSSQQMYDSPTYRSESYTRTSSSERAPRSVSPLHNQTSSRDYTRTLNQSTERDHSTRTHNQSIDRDYTRSHLPTSDRDHSLSYHRSSDRGLTRTHHQTYERDYRTPHQTSDRDFTRTHHQTYERDYRTPHQTSDRDLTRTHHQTYERDYRTPHQTSDRDFTSTHHQTYERDYRTPHQTSDRDFTRTHHQSSERDSVYSVDESQDLLREIQQARQQNQLEISRAEETLKSYNRYRSATPNHNSSYSNSGVLDTSILSGSYELYDERSTFTTSRSSSMMSLDSDSVLNMSSVSHTRPIRSSDIKLRILQQRRKNVI